MQTHALAILCVNKCKLTRIQAHAHIQCNIYARAYARSIVYHRSGFDCEILLLRIASFSIIRNQKNRRKNNMQLIIYCPLSNSQSLKSQSGLYSTIRNRLTTQSKPDIQYTRTQFAQTNGLTTRTRVYIINASNAMPKPYLYTCVHVRARGRSRTVLANARMQTQINARKLIVAFDVWAISACTRVCVLRVRSKTFRMYYTNTTEDIAHYKYIHIETQHMKSYLPTLSTQSQHMELHVYLPTLQKTAHYKPYISTQKHST